MGFDPLTVERGRLLHVYFRFLIRIAPSRWETARKPDRFDAGPRKNAGDFQESLPAPCLRQSYYDLLLRSNFRAGLRCWRRRYGTRRYRQRMFRALAEQV